MIRGLFGSSARQAVPFAEPETLPMGAGIMPGDQPRSEPLPVAGDKPFERSYLGGLIKYQRPEAGSGPNALTTIGATLQDVAANLRGDPGGNLEAVQEQFRQRQARAEKESLRKRLEEMALDLYPDDQEAQLLFKANPDAFVEQRLKAREPQAPVIVNTRLGPRAYNPKTGEYKTLEDIPEKLPFGWTRDEDGNPQIDPEFVEGQRMLTDARAAANAAHRAPPRGRVSSGGGGRASAGAGDIPPPPAGYRIVTP